MKTITMLMLATAAMMLSSCGWKCSTYPNVFADGKGGVDVYKYNIRCSKRF